jgi:hypothetical protein
MNGDYSTFAQMTDGFIIITVPQKDYDFACNPAQRGRVGHG